MLRSCTLRLRPLEQYCFFTHGFFLDHIVYIMNGKGITRNNYIAIATWPGPGTVQ